MKRLRLWMYCANRRWCVNRGRCTCTRGSVKEYVRTAQRLRVEKNHWTDFNKPYSGDTKAYYASRSPARNANDASFSVERNVRPQAAPDRANFYFSSVRKTCVSQTTGSALPAGWAEDRVSSSWRRMWRKNGFSSHRHDIRSLIGRFLDNRRLTSANPGQTEIRSVGDTHQPPPSSQTEW